MSMILKGNSGINFKVDTVDDLLTLEGSEGEVVIVSDENRGGTFVYRSADVATNNGGTVFNGWCRQYDGAVNVKWFGARSTTEVGYEDYDSKNAIQSAVDTGLEIYFPEGHYVVSSTITADTMFLYGDKSPDTSTIEYTATDGTPLFNTTGYYDQGKYISFTNLTLLGAYTNGSATDCIGIKFENALAEDIDAFVNQCNFSGFRKSIYIKGRGLYIDNCTFVVSLDCIYFDRNNPIIEGTENDQKEESGARAYWIRNCRFHALAQGSILTNIETNNELLRGILFDGNYIDTSARIMNGACRESAFTGNLHIYGYNGGDSDDKVQTLFYSDFDWENVTISGNTFSSIQQSATTTAMEHERIIYLGANTPVTCSGLTFNGNTIFGVEREVIKIICTSSNNINISNNTMNEICKYAMDDSPNTGTRPVRVVEIDASTSINRCTIESNVIVISNEANVVAQSNLDYVVYFPGTGSVNYTTCVNNKFNESIMLAANKNAFYPDYVIQSKNKLQTSDVNLLGSSPSPLLLISQDITKKSITSYLAIRWNGIVKGNNSVATNLPNIKIYVDDVAVSKNYYVDNITNERKHIAITDIITGTASNIKIYASTGTSNPVDYTVFANSMLTVEEIEQ